MFFSSDMNKPIGSKVPLPFKAILFVSDHGNSTIGSLTRSIPLPLLPIVNQPALSYVLEWLEEANIKELILVLPPSENLEAEALITHYLTKKYQGSVKVEIMAIDNTKGSVQILIDLKDQFPGHCVVLNGLFLTQSKLSNLLQFHLTNLPSLSGYLCNTMVSDHIVTNSEQESLPLIGIEAKSSKWVYMKNDINKEEPLVIKTSLLNHFPRVNFHSSLDDSQVYIFSNKLIQSLSTLPNIQSISNDLIPLLIKSQSRPNLESTKLFNNAISKVDDDLIEIDQNENLICLCLVDRSGLGGKLNNLITYHELNRQYGKLQSNQTKLPNSSSLEGSAQIGSDSLIGNNSTIGDKSSIKKSIIGNNVTIGKLVKLTNCILMDECIIEDGVKLDSCILGFKVKVGDKSQLKDCLLASSVIINKSVVKKNETILD